MSAAAVITTQAVIDYVDADPNEHGWYKVKAGGNEYDTKLVRLIAEAREARENGWLMTISFSESRWERGINRRLERLERVESGDGVQQQALPVRQEESRVTYRNPPHPEEQKSIRASVVLQITSEIYRDLYSTPEFDVAAFRRIAGNVLTVLTELYEAQQ